jgi:GntR family transcriptional regulator, transcriptional repressor for pyruvate dehydrogenase complex
VLRKAHPESPFPYIVLTAPQQIAAAIKREILEGVLKPGDRLPPEQDLAELFGVSRPTVRVGLHALCAAEILVVQRGRQGGYRVGDFSFEHLEASVTEFISLSLVMERLKPAQFLEVRYAHELLGAETAARVRTDESVKQLEGVQDEFAACEHDPKRAFETDLRFHRVLAEATMNPLIVSIEGAMIAVLRQFFGDGPPVAPRETLRNLSEIIDAVRDQDPDAAQLAMRRHLAVVTRYGLDRDQTPFRLWPAATAG